MQLATAPRQPPREDRQRTSANDSCALNIAYPRHRGLCNFTKEDGTDVSNLGQCQVDVPISAVDETYSLGPSIYRKAPARNKSWVGGKVVLYGTEFRSAAIGMWAPQAIVYNLSGPVASKWRQLVLYVGIDQGETGSGIGETAEPMTRTLLGWYLGWYLRSLGWYLHCLGWYL